MDWSRIKTIFIISFLLLDIYLVFQFMNTRSEANYEVIEEASIEEKLKNDDIKYNNEASQQLEKERYISVKPKVFTQADLSANQALKISNNIDGTTIIGQLEEPIKIGAEFNPDELILAVKGIVQSGEKYRFWKKDDLEGTITFYQLYEGKMLYNNLNGKLTFYLNDKNEVVSYEQTYSEEIEKLSNEQEILTKLGAIETLYKKGLLKPKSEITKVELGYSTLVQLAASQVLAPTWRVVVNGEENLFVHAFEGQVIQFNQDENNITE
ncbi:Two-component signal transduction system YycFG, regulatory protein YycI [Mesobacillus persicus]|uniref:Two-component signal transduction system YycFG, regulatory protein YycI n=1 Tax=Mesobacillus persicus TaxID=930146 RepID=A0A1H8GJ62_9BACI|nr:two-component system regulatory protein YycI [Mesobacillus persicus]SEN43348.1 Two-component signal transduction system YycFG, regulatory protein YycI [Mesobacillus persicus]